MPAFESARVDGIARLLSKRGAWWTKTTGIKLVGCPDIIACYKGTFIAIEVKSDVGRATQAQLRQLSLVKRAGGEAMIATHWTMVETVLNDIDRTMRVGEDYRAGT